MNRPDPAGEMKRREFLGATAAAAALGGVELGAAPAAGQEPGGGPDAKAGAAQLYKRHAPKLRGHDRALPDLGDFAGMKAQKAEGELPSAYREKEIRRIKELGLEPADSIQDKSEISCFQRGSSPHWSGINTFLKLPYLEDVRKVGEYDIAFVGAPFDIGCTFRTGTRFGPQGMRRISALYQKYSYEHGLDLGETLAMCDVGDIFCPADITKGHDQITKGIAHILSRGTLPMIMGGDHSIGYPIARAVAQNVEGKVGIIHIDRHVDTQEKDMDEIMHTCPWFHATNIPNCPPSNLVQLGIGGWQVPRAGVKVGRDRGTTILTVNDIEKVGVDKTVEIALEVAWKGASAVYLSFDIDALDAGFVPGTGWPEPGGLLPREALGIVNGIAREGIVAMEVCEVSPPYDISDVTSLMGVRLMMDAIGTMAKNGRIGGRLKI
jgi:agmatinase